MSAPIVARANQGHKDGSATKATKTTTIKTLCDLCALCGQDVFVFFVAAPHLWRRHLDITHYRHHDAHMRTTLTLDRDVADALAKEMRRSGRGLKATVNEVLRRGLRLAGKAPRPPRFEVQPHDFGFKPGIDLDRMNQLVDELEVEETARKLRR